MENWSDTLREGYKLRVFQNLVLRNVLRPHTGEEIKRRTEYQKNRSFVICKDSQEGHN